MLYGTGNGADKALDRLASDGTPVAGVFAGDGFVRDREFRGFRVESYPAAVSRLGEFVAVMCFGSALPEVLENVKRIAAERELRIADIPVADDVFFDEAFYGAHADRLRRVRALLADEQSRTLFDRLVSFKLRGMPEDLFAAVTPMGAYDDLLAPPPGGVIVDLGAYTGDTAAAFARRYPAYGGIVAVEPEPRNYRKLCESTAGLRDFSAVNALAGARDGVSFVDGARRGRGAAAGAAGIKTDVVCVDSLLRGGRADLIKLDVEGAEAEALLGAAETLRRYRPKLTVSCYHRSEDLFRLPETVLGLQPAYRVYLRRGLCVPAWDAEFVFV